ncbi:MAG: AMP-binding protein, partial [Bacteroidota bacterium]|nr:AMP-binding protein [Bacteroidota bacterium]
MEKIVESLTIKNILNLSINEYSENSSLSYVNGPKMTYKVLDKKVKEAVLLLQQFGVSKGDKIAILSRNMPNWGVVYLAITSMGAIAVPLLPDFHKNEIENIIEHSESKLLFVSELLLPKIKDINFESLLTKINIETFDIFESVIEKDNNISEINDFPVFEDDLASIIYTSGTTGTTKGV